MFSPLGFPGVSILIKLSNHSRIIEVGCDQYRFDIVGKYVFKYGCHGFPRLGDKLLVVPREANLVNAVPLDSPIILFVHEGLAEQCFDVIVVQGTELLYREQTVENVYLDPRAIEQCGCRSEMNVLGANTPVTDGMSNSEMWLTKSEYVPVSPS